MLAVQLACVTNLSSSWYSGERLFRKVHKQCEQAIFYFGVEPHNLRIRGRLHEVISVSKPCFEIKVNLIGSITHSRFKLLSLG